MNTNEIILQNPPKIAGLRFRKFLGESDFPGMVAIIDAASRADRDENAITLADIQHDYQHLTNSDPYQDIIIAEINAQPVAYSRVE